MRLLQVETEWWLVVDDVVRPRFMVHYGPTTNDVGETLIRYRVQRWHLERSLRRTEAWFDTLEEVAVWCRAMIDTSAFGRPHLDEHGEVVTAEEQRRRAEAGLDPRTGDPVTLRSDISNLAALQAGVLAYDDLAARWATVADSPDSDELEIARSDLVVAAHLLADAARRILGQDEPAAVALLPRL